MYKKGVKTLPRCFKKKLVKQFPEFFKSIDDIRPLVGSYFTVEDEQEMVSLLSQITGLPSFWLVTTTHSDYKEAFWLIFESNLNNNTKKQLEKLLRNHSEIFFLSPCSLSKYYGIY